MRIAGLAAIVLLSATLAQAQYGFVDKFDGTGLNERWMTAGTGADGTGDQAWDFTTGANLTYAKSASGLGANAFLCAPVFGGNIYDSSQSVVMGTALPTGDYVATIKMSAAITSEMLQSWGWPNLGLALYSNAGTSFFTLGYKGSAAGLDDTYGPGYDTGVDVLLASPQITDSLVDLGGGLMGAWPKSLPITGVGYNPYHVDFGSSPFELRIAKTGNTYALSYSSDMFETSTQILNPSTTGGVWTYVPGTDGDALTNIGFYDMTGSAGTVVPTTIYNFVVAPLNGDTDGDGIIDGVDFQAVAGHWLNTGETRLNGDVSGDGIVDGVDFQAVAGNWLTVDPYAGTYDGAAGLTPEPVTMALLALGGLGLLRRRK